MQKVDCESKDGQDFQICPKFEKVFSILGQKWNGLILEVLVQAGPQRFKDLAHCVTKCSDRVLVERLKHLEEEGLVERRTYPNSALIEYCVTKKGAALQPVLEKAHSFADDWY